VVGLLVGDGRGDGGGGAAGNETVKEVRVMLSTARFLDSAFRLIAPAKVSSLHFFRSLTTDPLCNTSVLIINVASIDSTDVGAIVGMRVGTDVGALVVGADVGNGLGAKVGVRTLVVIELVVIPIVCKSGIESTFSTMAAPKFGRLSIADTMTFGSAPLPRAAMSTYTITAGW
jgi:hypothetical protein